MSEEVTEKVLTYCKKVIQELQQKTKNKRKVFLLNEIIHFTSKAYIEDSDDQRKNTRYLRDLLNALCDFYYQEEFMIPKSWNRTGNDKLILLKLNNQNNSQSQKQL